jgi:hypothetical protein
MNGCKRQLVGMAALIGVGVLVLTAWQLWPRTAITRENAEQIQPGMTLTEVEAILGGPARDEYGGPLVADSTPEEAEGEFARLFANPGGDVDPFRRPLCPSDAPTQLIGASSRAVVQVHLDGAGRVVSCNFLAVRAANPLDHVRRWLRL